MAEEIKSCENINDEYLYSLKAKEGNVILDFQNSKIIFNSYLVFKNGYPNEEVLNVQKHFLKNNLKLSTIYQIINSSWVEEIKISNRVHPRHKDEIFDKFKHYMIFFSDESFECIADSYEIKR